MVCDPILDFRAVGFLAQDLLWSACRQDAGDGGPSTTIDEVRSGTTFISEVNRASYVRNAKYIVAHNPGIEYNDALLYR